MKASSATLFFLTAVWWSTMEVNAAEAEAPSHMADDPTTHQQKPEPEPEPVVVVVEPELWRQEEEKIRHQAMEQAKKMHQATKAKQAKAKAKAKEEEEKLRQKEEEKEKAKKRRQARRQAKKTQDSGVVPGALGPIKRALVAVLGALKFGMNFGQNFMGWVFASQDWAMSKWLRQARNLPDETSSDDEPSSDDEEYDNIDIEESVYSLTVETACSPAVHGQKPGSVWIAAGLSSLPMLFLVAAALILSSLKKQKKAGLEGVSRLNTSHMKCSSIN